MADPFSSVGWLRHVKGRRECSKVSVKQASQRMKKAGKILLTTPAKTRDKHCPYAITRNECAEKTRNGCADKTRIE